MILSTSRPADPADRGPNTKTPPKKPSKIRVEIDPLPVITDPREAFKQGKLKRLPEICKGDVNEAFKNCTHIFLKAAPKTGGQEQLYLETQGAYAYPAEHNSVKYFPPHRGLPPPQRTVARVLGVKMNQVEVDVPRPAVASVK